MPDKRIMGKRCKSWNKAEKKCSRDWEDCKPKVKKGETTRTRCNYEFVYSLGAAPSPQGWGTPGEDGSFDVEKTAKACFDKYVSHSSGSKGVPNFTPYSVMKGNVNKFNELIKTMSDHVDKTYRNLPADKRTEANLKLFQNFDNVRSHIIKARTRDNGKYL